MLGRDPHSTTNGETCDAVGPGADKKAGTFAP